MGGRLTRRGFKDGDLALFQAGVQGPHKLQLNVVWRVRMVEILGHHSQSEGLELGKGKAENGGVDERRV